MDSWHVTVNGRRHEGEAAPETPLLWILREHLGLTGTKYGCGIGRCGACTVHLDGKAVRSCSTPISKASGRTITTIEGLTLEGDHPVQRAWVEEDVPQCGYCQSGQIMTATALIASNPDPDDKAIDRAMSGNLCRCGTYQRIRRAIHRAAEIAREPRVESTIAAQGPREAMDGGEASGDRDEIAVGPFVRIGTDGWITIVVNHSEMGQGVYTALPMLVAEELECRWERVRIESAPVDAVYNHTEWGVQGTGGSTSIASEWERMRTEGARVREMLIAAAAEGWKVPAGECRAEQGRIYHPDGRSVGFEAVAAAAATRQPPERVAFKDPSTFRIIGKATPRLESGARTRGEGIYGIDATVDGVLVAVVARAPRFGATVNSFDAAKARAVDGVVDVLQIAAGVAVVARDFWTARTARELLEIRWDQGAGISTDRLMEEYRELATQPGNRARDDGDAVGALQTAARRIAATYELPFLAHACMEPLNCLADVKEERCDIWTGSQMQTNMRRAAAQVSGLPEERVHLHTTLLGGGFGRRLNVEADFVVDAVELSKRMARPVKVIWTREDDMSGGWYRPMFCHRLEGGLDGDGRIVGWHHTAVGQSIVHSTEPGVEPENGIDPTSVEGAADLPYEIPNVLVELHTPRSALPVQWWRSVGHSHTAFAVESFIDELAAEAGIDPYEFRKSLLTGPPRLLAVMELAVEQAGWHRPLEPGRGRGLAAHASFGGFAAEVVEVTVTEDRKLSVDRVVCAVDCGTVVNPRTVDAQMEGGIVFGLTAALHGQITLQDGRVEQQNFDTYPLLTIREMPEIEVHIMPSSLPPTGAGEPSVPPIAPALANAIYSASGIRVRRLPVRL